MVWSQGGKEGFGNGLLFLWEQSDLEQTSEAISWEGNSPWKILQTWILLMLAFIAYLKICDSEN